MPVTHLLHPKTGEALSFTEAPARLASDGLMPEWAVEAVIAEHEGEKPSFFVRPSDVSPQFTCRRQRVWQSAHPYGVNPLAEEAMVEGSAMHAAFKAHEIEVPPEGARLEICGVPMRGRLDWLFDDRIEDLKTSTPFWIPKFPSKEAKAANPFLRPSAEIWEPKDGGAGDVKGWQTQLSIYRILLEKSGRKAPRMGRVWRRYSGVKTDKPRYKRFDFPLLDEAELEASVGDWIRVLAAGLGKSEVDAEAWRGVPADGREMVGSKGNYWKCGPCPLKYACFKQDALEVW